MEENPTRICELIVGLGDVEVLGVDDEPAGPLAVHVRTRRRPACWGCGGAVWPKGTSAVRLVDLPAFGWPVRLIWHKCRRSRRWCTSIVDVTGGQLLDIVPGRDAEAPIGWLLAQPSAWRDGIAWGVLDLSGAYRRSFEVVLPQAGQVADPFHVIRLANNSIDEVRRRTQNDTLGHRCRKDDPLYRARRLLIAAHERLSDRGDAKLRGLLTAGDPRGEVRLAWYAKETLRGLYDVDCAQLAGAYLGELADDLTDTDCPPELHCLGRTLGRWHTPIVNWHRARVTNGPTEAINNLVKRVKRAAFGFRRFAHYRIRALLYAGKPNWALLATVTPR